MTKKQIKQLANASFTKDSLDSKKVDKITKHLKRNELKVYIKALKNIENSKKVTFLIPIFGTSSNTITESKRLFPNKKIELKEDKTLLAGIRLIDKDNIYDFNLKNTFEKLVGFINQ